MLTLAAIPVVSYVAMDFSVAFGVSDVKDPDVLRQIYGRKLFRITHYFVGRKLDKFRVEK